jgi:hypothetical protein
MARPPRFTFKPEIVNSKTKTYEINTKINGKSKLCKSEPECAMQAARRGSTPEPPTPPPSVELALRHGLAKRPSGHLRASSGLAFGNLGTGIVLYFQALESFAWLLLLMLVRPQTVYPSPTLNFERVKVRFRVSGLAFGNLGTGIVLYFQALESFAWLLLLMLVRLTPQPGSSPARLEKRTLRWDETVGGGGAATESKHRL